VVNGSNVTRVSRNRCRERFLYLLCALFVFSINSSAFSAEFSVTAFVDKNTIPVGEAGLLSIRISGKQLGQIAPIQIPTVPHLLVSNAGTTQETQIINMEVRRARILNYTVAPQSEGTITIPAIPITIDGREYRTSPIQIEAVATYRRPAPPRPESEKVEIQDKEGLRDERAFLELALDKSEVYVGEQVTATYYIYYNPKAYRRTPRISDAVEPTFPGIEIVAFDTKNQLPEEVSVGGVRYIRYIVKRVALIPIHAPEGGLYEVDSLRVTLAGSRHLFDDFFADSILFGRRRKPRSPTLHLETKTAALAIKKLPPYTGRGKFSGSVGEFTMSAQMKSKTYNVGSAATLGLTLSGKGRILSQPSIQLPRALEVYEPTVKKKMNTQEGKVSEVKRFEYLIIPHEAGIYPIDKISYVYFNTRTGRYDSLLPEGLSMEVTGIDATADRGGLAKQRSRSRGISATLRYIKPDKATFAKQHGSGWFLIYLIYLLALSICFGGLWAFQNHRRQILRDPSSFRKRTAFKTAQKALINGQRQHDHTAAAREVETVLLNYIGDKINTSANILTNDQLEAVFRKQGLPQELCNEFFETRRLCESLQWSGSKQRPSESATIFHRTERLLEKMEKQFTT